MVASIASSAVEPQVLRGRAVCEKFYGHEYKIPVSV